MGGERSKGGCWTCKLRKKKCDESRPVCSICQGFGIICHGYGIRPSWMTGGAEEKEIVKDLRLKVKEATSRKRKSRSHGDSYTQQALVDTEMAASRQISPYLDTPSTFFQTFDSPTSISRAASLAIDWPPSQETNSSLYNAYAEKTGSTNGSGSYLSSTAFFGAHFTEDEAGLWMHYLDNTFPLQFPFYKPTTNDGGRGWLFAIVMQTEPLYHTVLSVASYHQHYALLYDHLEIDGIQDCPRLDEQLRRYTLSLQKFQSYLEAATSSQKPLSKSDCLRLLACIVFLISLEAFQSTGDDWKIHLKAAVNLMPQMKESCDPQPQSVTQDNTLRFIVGTLFWYDTLSCISAETQQFIPTRWLSTRPGYLPLAKIMGCEDWAILKIRDITMLRKWKESMLANKTLSLRDLVTRATKIESSLEHGIKSTTLSIDSIKSANDFLTNFDVLDYGSKYMSLIVTRIFAQAALTYLFVTVSGANPELPEIKSSIDRIVGFFRALPHPKFFRSLSWPLCISGCMATENHQEMFREFVLKHNANTYVFGSSKHVLKIMEKCWEMRKSGDYGVGEVDWSVTMASLSLNILLV